MARSRIAATLFTMLALMSAPVGADVTCPVAPCDIGDCDAWEALFLGPVDESTAEVCQDAPAPAGANIRYAGGAHPEGYPVGQTFTSDEGVYRIDLLMKNRNDHRPFTVRVWRWVDQIRADFVECGFDYNFNTEPAKTTGKSPFPPTTPLWEETVSLPNEDGTKLITLYPRLPAETCTLGGPQLYYLEVGDPGGLDPSDGYWQVGATHPDPLDDAYEPGALRMDNWFRSATGKCRDSGTVYPVFCQDDADCLEVILPCPQTDPCYCEAMAGGSSAKHQDLFFRVYTTEGSPTIPQIDVTDHASVTCDATEECDEQLSCDSSCRSGSAPPAATLCDDPAPPAAGFDALSAQEFEDILVANFRTNALCTQPACLETSSLPEVSCASLYAYDNATGQQGWTDGAAVAYDTFANELRYRRNPNAVTYDPSGQLPACRQACNSGTWGQCVLDPCTAACDYSPANHQWMLGAILAYQWASPDWSDPEQHAEAIRLLVRGAFEFWEIRELGTMNRAMAGSMTFYAVTNLLDATTLQGIVADPQNSDLFGGYSYDPATLWDDWRAYADLNWNEYRNPALQVAYENQEDSSHYNSLGLAYVLAIDELRKNEPGWVSIWNDTGFGKIVEREYHAQLPPGVQAVFGDTNGVSQDWVLRTLLFTRAWDRLQDERYRLAAYRSADFQRRYFHGSPSGDTLNWSIYAEWVQLALLHAELATLPPNEISNAQPAAQHGEFLAVDQNNDSSSVKSSNGGGELGQTFRLPAGADGIFKIELQAIPKFNGPMNLNLWDGAPGTSASLLYQDTVQVSSGLTTLTLSPALLDDPAGRQYYVELSAGGRFSLVTSNGDALPGESLYKNGSPIGAPRDAWLKVYDLNDLGSSWTERQGVSTRPGNLVGNPAKRLDSDPGTIVPDKMVLRSGYDTDDFHAVVNLVAGNYSHGHAETGAVVSMTDNGSVLLVGSEYLDGMPKHLSESVVKRHFGNEINLPNDISGVLSAVVDRFLDAREVTIAKLSWEDRWGWGIEQQRELYFAKNGFLVVRDRTGIPQSGRVTSGVQWRAKELYREIPSATDWAHLFHRTPKGVNCKKYNNFDRYLYVELIPDGPTAGNRFSYLDPPRDDPNSPPNPPTPPVVFGEVATNPTESSGQQSFTSVLVPHGGHSLTHPDPDDVVVVNDSSDQLVLEIRRPEESPDVRWLFVRNEGAGPLSVTDAGIRVDTDASVVFARMEGGVPTYVFVENGTCVEWQTTTGTLCRHWGSKSSAEAFDPDATSCTFGSQVCQ